MSLIAKPVINKQYWILQENDRKVGNVEACAGGYQIKINNQVVAQYKTIKMVEQRGNIKFDPPMITTAPRKRSSTNTVHGYATAGRAYNPVWDVKMKLPIYTKTSKSKSWFAAGWYQVKKGRNWTAVQDPKLIVLQRYSYHGPYHTREEIQ
jgi:hypothetical protein